MIVSSLIFFEAGFHHKIILFLKHILNYFFKLKQKIVVKENL